MKHSNFGGDRTIEGEAALYVQPQLVEMRPEQKLETIVTKQIVAKFSRIVRNYAGNQHSLHSALDVAIDDVADAFSKAIQTLKER